MENTFTFGINTASTSDLADNKANSVAQAQTVVIDTTLDIQAIDTPIEQLKSLEVARIGWETNELAASNRCLYSILVKSYSFYLVMKKDANADVRKSKVDALEQFISERGYIFTASSHDMTRVIKCVFGVDRRRVSAYSIALREALRQEVAAEDLVDFIEQNGGVEQIRMGGTKPLSTTKKAELVKNSVISSDLGTIKFDPLSISADAEWTDKQVVIIATYLPTGEFQVNAVVKHDSAVKSALAAHHSNQQAKLRAESKAERDAAKVEQEELKNAENAAKAAEAAQKVLDAAREKQNKLKSQIEKIESERVAAELTLSKSAAILELAVA